MTTHHNFKTMWNFRSFTLNPSLTQNGIRKYCSIQKLLNDLEAWATIGNCCLVPLLGYGDLSKFSIRFQVLTVEWVRHDKFFFQIWEGVSEIEICYITLFLKKNLGVGVLGLAAWSPIEKQWVQQKSEFWFPKMSVMVKCTALSWFHMNTNLVLTNWFRVKTNTLVPVSIFPNWRVVHW